MARFERCGYCGDLFFAEDVRRVKKRPALRLLPFTRNKAEGKKRARIKNGLIFLKKTLIL